jgi:hypothetical protein
VELLSPIRSFPKTNMRILVGPSSAGYGDTQFNLVYVHVNILRSTYLGQFARSTLGTFFRIIRFASKPGGIFQQSN